MIKTREEMRSYIEADLKARGLSGKKDITFKKRISAFVVPQPWRFQELLRKAEYYTNVGGVML